MQRNLINVQNKVDNYPVTNTPQNNYVLVYSNGTLSWQPQSGGGGGITTVNSVGSGQSIINSVTPSTLNLKSIFAGSGILITASSTEVIISLNVSITNQYLYSNGTSIIGKDAIENCYSLPGGQNIYAYTNSSGAFFRGLTASSGISLTNVTDNILIGNNGILTVTSNPTGSFDLIQTTGQNTVLKKISAGTGLGFTDFGGNITMNNNGIITLTSVVTSTATDLIQTLGQNTVLKRITQGTGMTFNDFAGVVTITNNGIRTLINSGAGSTLINPASTVNNIQLKSIVAGSNITITNNANNLTISSTGSGTPVNIYNSDGTMTANPRIVTGLNPGDISNSIIWSDIIPGYNSSWMQQSNVPIENNPYSGIQDPNLLMASTYNGSQSKFIFGGWSYLSQKIECKLPDTLGDGKELFGIYSNLNGGKCFIMQVTLCDVENQINGFSGTWEFTINSHDLGLGWMIVKPKSTTLCNYTGNENFFNLWIRQNPGFGASGILFAFVQAGLGTGAFYSRYLASFYCWHQGDGSCGIYDNYVTLGLTAPYYPPEDLIVDYQGFNTPSGGSFEYKKFGRDLKLTFLGSAQQIVNGQVQSQLEIYFNGQLIMSINIDAQSVQNVNVGVNKIAVMKYMDLISTGALSIAASTPYTFNLTNPGNYQILYHQMILEYY